MKDNCTYLIKLRGQVSEIEINAMSPIWITVRQVEVDGTLLALTTDQSGLVGMMSYLHRLGLIFLAITRMDWPGAEDC